MWFSAVHCALVQFNALCLTLRFLLRCLATEAFFAFVSKEAGDKISECWWLVGGGGASWGKPAPPRQPKGVDTSGGFISAAR